MRSTEFIREAGPGGPGRQMTDAEYAAQQAQGEKNLQGIKNFFAGAPQTGGTAVPTARDPAQRAGQGAATAAPTAPVAVEPPAAPASSFAGQTDEFGGMEQPAPEVVQTATPNPAAAAAKLPTRPGQQTSGRQADPATKALQDKLIAAGAKIKADGIMGPATQAAIRQFGIGGTPSTKAGTMDAYKTRAPSGQTSTPATAAPPRPGIGMAAQFEWDRQYGKTHNANGTTKSTIAQTSTPATAAPPRPGIGMAAQFEWDRQYGKTHNDNGTTKGTIAQDATAAPPQQRQGGPMRESSFEYSVDRMRRLSNMLKG